MGGAIPLCGDGCDIKGMKALEFPGVQDRFQGPHVSLT